MLTSAPPFFPEAVSPPPGPPQGRESRPRVETEKRILPLFPSSVPAGVYSVGHPAGVTSRLTNPRAVSHVPQALDRMSWGLLRSRSA